MTQTGGTFKKIAEQWTGLDLNELEHVQDLALPTSQVARTSFEYALDDNFNEENPESAIPKLLDLLHDVTPEEADHIHSMLKILGYPGRNSKTAAIRRSTVMRIHNELKKGEGFVPEFEIDDTPFPGPNKFILDIDLSVFWVPVDFDGNIHEDGYPFHSHVQSALMDKLSDDTMVSGYFANGPESMMGIPAYTAQLWCVNYDEIPDFYYDRVMQTFEEAKLINWNYQTLKDERESEDPTVNNRFYDGDKLVLTQDIEDHPAGDTAEFISRRPGGQTAWIQTSDGSMIEAPFEAFDKTAATIRDDAMVEIEQFLPEIDRLAQEMECKDDDWCGRATEDIAEYLEENGIEATPYMPGEDYETEQEFGGVSWDRSHAYIVLEDGTIIDPTITQFTAGQFEDYPHHPSAPNVAVIPYGHPFGENYEVHQTAYGFIERPEWLKESAVVREDGTVGFEINQKVVFRAKPEDEFFIKDLDGITGYVVALENDKGQPRVVVQLDQDGSTRHVPPEYQDRLEIIQGTRPFIFVVAEDGRTEREYTDQGQNFHNELAKRLGAEEKFDVDENMDEIPTGDVEEHGFVRGVWNGSTFYAVPEWNVEEFEELPVFTEEQKETISQYISEVGVDSIQTILIEDGEGEHPLTSFKIAAVINEDGTVGFEGDDLGNNHKFILTPDGEFYAWGKKEYDYGKGMLAIENEGQIWDELDDFTKYEWERDSSDTYNFYRNQGYATGTTSSGGFFMINAPSGLNEEQIQALEDLFRQQGYKSIVIHESGTRNFFNRGKDALDWLSPRRNAEPEEKEYPEFFEGKPEKDLWKEADYNSDITNEEIQDRPIIGVDNKFAVYRDQYYFWESPDPHHIEVAMWAGWVEELYDEETDEQEVVFHINEDEVIFGEISADGMIKTYHPHQSSDMASSIAYKNIQYMLDEQNG